jgi:DNA-binding response OmpR family regulator
MAHPILLDDDGVTLRSIAARALRLEEYEVVDKKTRLDLAITDSRLNHRTGSELVTRLRAHTNDPMLLAGLRALLDGKH